MNIEQAVAILEAERVLQGVGCGGPDNSSGSAWYDYVKQAGRTLVTTSYRDEFTNLHMLKE